MSYSEKDIKDFMKVSYNSNNTDYIFYKNDIIDAINKFKNNAVYVSLGLGFYIIKDNNKYYLKDIHDKIIFKANNLEYISWFVD